MIYRNIKTGAEIFTKSKIIAPGFVLVEEKKEAPKQEPPKSVPPKEEPPKPETKKVANKVKSAPKKRGTRK